MTAISSQSAGRTPSHESRLKAKLRTLVARFRAGSFLKRKAPRHTTNIDEPARVRNVPPRQHRVRLIIVALVILFAYPVLGTLALTTGFAEWALRSEDLRVEITKPAYTILPGRIHLAGVRVLANGDTQFILEGNDLVVDINLLELVRRRVRVTRLAANGVRYQMRVQVENEKGIEERLAAYPPLTDIPGAKVIREKDAKKSEDAESPWTVEVSGLDITVRELWFFEYRFLGDGRLRGGFLVGPNIMSVSTAVQDVGPGELRFGPKHVVAKNLRGQITANIPTVNPNERADASFLELVTARVQLRAEVQSLSHLGAYVDGIEFKNGSGPFAVDAFLERGFLGDKSRLEFTTDDIRLKDVGFGIQSDVRIDFDAKGEKGHAGDSRTGYPLLKASAKATYVSFARADREFTVQIHNHREEAALDTIRLSKSTDLRRAALQMPTILSKDLDDLNAVLPEGFPLTVQGGEANGSITLNMDARYWIRGPVNLRVESAMLDAAGIQVGARAVLKTTLAFNPKLKTHMLQNAALSFRNVDTIVDSDRIDNWWSDITTEKLTLWTTEPPRMEGTIRIRTRDLEPLLESLAEKDKLSDIVPTLTDLDDFRAKITARLQSPVADVTLESESDVWDASGRLHKNASQTRMAFVVGGQGVSLGIANLGNGLELQPLAKTGWLNEKLRALPKPLEQMAPAKP